MRAYLLIPLLLWHSISAFGQHEKDDSLRTVLARHPKADTFRVNRLNELANALLSKDIPGDSIANAALQLAQQLNYVRGQAKALINLSHNAQMSLQLSASQQLAEKALKVAQQTNDKRLLLEAYLLTAKAGSGHISPQVQNQMKYRFAQSLALARQLHDTTMLADIELTMGGWYMNQSNHAAALQHAFAGLQMSKKAGVDPSLQREALTMISMTYSVINDYEQALIYHQQAMAIPPPPEETVSMTASRKLYELRNLAGFYTLMGRYGEAEKTLLHILQAKEQNPQWVQVTLSELAHAYERQGKYQLALSTAFAVLRQARQSDGESLSTDLVYPTLGSAYLHTNRPDSAIYYSSRAFRQAQQRNFKLLIQSQSEVLAQAYAQLHHFDKAYTYLHTSIAYRDSLDYEGARRKATAARFNEQLLAQKNRVAFLDKTRLLEAQAARRQQILLLFLVGLGLMLLVLAYVLWRNNQQKQQANRVLDQQKQQIEQTLTELQTTQAQLIQKEKLASLGELTAGIAHEIQNPLNFVNNFAELSVDLAHELQEEIGKVHLPDTDKAYLSDIVADLARNQTKINQHGQRAAAIVRGMLEHARTDSGEKRPTDLNALCEEYLKIAYHGLRAKDPHFACELVTDLDAHLERVAVPPQEIGRVLLNLYTNAFYAVGQRARLAEGGYQPTLILSTKGLAKGIEIRVKDNGTGIPEAVQAKIFQPFFTTKPTGEGTGLGLSLSYDIITKGHGGTLTVESVEGQGTEFIICLPAA